MSYTQIKDCIREDVLSQLIMYKRGTKKQQHIVPKLEEFINTVNCFQCLDTKQSWYFREQSHRLDNKGDYYVMTCAVCPNEQVKDKWIKDSKTCDLYGVSGIKLFNKENYSGAERFEELEKYVCKIYPEIIEEDPVYTPFTPFLI